MRAPTPSPWRAWPTSTTAWRWWDTVTSLGGVPLKVDDWEMDAVYSGSQKCLSCAPGLSPVTIGPRAVERIRGRDAPVQSWFMDANLVMGYWGSGQQRSYHHTAPINALYGLHEALVILQEEGLEQAWDRHRRRHLALAAGLEAMGLGLAVPQAERLPQLNVVPATLVQLLPANEDQMERRQIRYVWMLLLGAIFAVALAGCSDDDVDNTVKPPSCLSDATTKCHDYCQTHGDECGKYLASLGYTGDPQCVYDCADGGTAVTACITKCKKGGSSDGAVGATP